MPKTKKLGKFEIDPNFDEEAHLINHLKEAREFLDKELSIIDNIEDITFQLICMFAMIDRLAQEQANYPQGPGKAKEAFCNFILKYQKQCDFLEKVEPITLYYHVESLIDEIVKIPGFPAEKEITIEDFGYLYATKAEKILSKGKSEEILKYIERKKGVDFANKKADEHRLISLIYRMRSKAVHEMSGLGEIWNWESEDIKPTEPYYREVSRTYEINGDWFFDNLIELVIPNKFIRYILSDCIEGYLDDCRKTKRLPFSNNRLFRKHNSSWYDK